LQILKKSINKATFIEALINFIIIYNLLFYIVKWLTFYAFCQVLNAACEGIILIAYATVYIKVKDAFFKHKDTVRKAL
jgi:hypothetical protein